MQIKSLAEYEETYKFSVDHPEEFWAGIARIFYGKRNGIRYYPGISLNRRLNGSKAQS